MPKVGRRSDHALHDYLRKDNRVQANAPFGTFYTPSIRMKIVGGRPVQVVEGELMPQEMYDQPQPRVVPRDRLPFLTRPLNPIQCTQPPQSVNPTPRATFASPEVMQPDPRLAGYSTAQSDRYNSHLHQQQMNPHPVLPPIPMKSPTPEAPMQPYHTHQVTSDPLSESPRLYRLLPRDTYLPREPLFLKRDEELQLSRLIRDEMSKYNSNKIKDVYMDLLGFDRNMTCYVSYQDLSQAFTKNQLHIPPQLLRLVAALYVSTREYGLVNYEKLITFLGGAAKMGTRDQSPPHASRRQSPTPYNSKQSNNNSPRESLQDRPNYYNHPNSPSPRDKCSSPRRSPVRDRDDAKLVRLVEQQFLAAPDRVDIDKVRSVFSEADRTHRETLSKQQIKQVALLCRLPLQDAILDRIIDRCEDRGLGQYDWIQFVEFIERIQPASTGLRIPTSKKPREYAKHYPTPGSNWPRAEDVSESQERPQQQQYKNVQYHTPRVNFDHDSKDQLSSMEKEIRKLEEQYQGMKDKMLHEQKYGPAGQDQLKKFPAENKSSDDINDKAWFDRFLKLVDGLYKNDVDHNGRLRADEVKWLTNEYDSAYGLNLPTDLKDEALQRAIYDGNKVELATYVKFLGMANP